MSLEERGSLFLDVAATSRQGPFCMQAWKDSFLFFLIFELVEKSLYLLFTLNSNFNIIVSFQYNLTAYFVLPEIHSIKAINNIGSSFVKTFHLASHAYQTRKHLKNQEKVKE